ncbi:putative protein N(5)-glutamine methyltransferase [Streptomyces sp. WMMC500]|uniref:putative protein N(5)-glutamine methyltransferase n=1 Tax=Streptomyces sp. WMMC500 TaxID=3015154 RepID=UPI00248AE1FC|nr:putative protein N(5)-glutamine methyltransferase [Streptomyces sp. WMMC500]WBB64751.1 putative protein N(5)-glutamine methyltransferase [Streptomyces sp. WMMC500]
MRAAGCVFAEDEARLLRAAASAPAELDALVARRVAGWPLEQVLGRAEFCGLHIVVEPGVFVPRRRSEFLVRRAARAAHGLRRPVVLDLCCGSGAIGAAVAAAVPGAELHAADVDPAAVRCARRNVGPAGGTVYEGDLYAALPARLRGRVDVLVVNAPYVPTAEVPFLPPEARDHEPLTALDGGADGLDVQRRVIADAPRWLAPGGLLLVETSERQEPRTRAAVVAAGLTAHTATCADLAATVVTGRAGRRGPGRSVRRTPAPGAA